MYFKVFNSSLQVYYYFLAFRAIAKEIEDPISAEPPAETKGNGIPVIGSNPKFIPKCIKLSLKNIKNIPLK